MIYCDYGGLFVNLLVLMVEATLSIFPSDQDLYKNQSSRNVARQEESWLPAGATQTRNGNGDQAGKMLRTGEACQILFYFQD
jgi:hypothetical protein